MGDDQAPEVVVEHATLEGQATRRVALFLAIFGPVLPAEMVFLFLTATHAHTVARLIANGLVAALVATWVALFAFALWHRARDRRVWKRLSPRVPRYFSEGRFTLTDEALCVDGVPWMRREDVRRGIVSALEGGRGRLVLHRRFRLASPVWGDVAVEVPSLDVAQDLARRLGTDVASAAADLPVQSPLVRWVFPSLIAWVPLDALALFCGPRISPLAYLVPFISFVPLALVAFLQGKPATVRIGTDGVEYRWAWRRRFISYRHVRDVVTSGGNFSLALSDGSKVTWRMWTDLVVIRIREALEAYRSRVADDGAAWLVRGDKPHREWVEALRALGAGGGRSYRAAPPSREVLWRFVEDPAAAVEARVGAAIALAASIGEEPAARERMRVAAKVTVSRELRAVLEGAAGDRDLDEEEALVDIFRAEETDHDRAGARRMGRSAGR